jgi:hypothetical protein
MAFVGIGLAVTIVKCTGSSKFARYFTIFSMPAAMIIAGAIGASMTHVILGNDGVYVAFVAFGVVAYVALACLELICEAKEAEEEGGSPSISVFLFLGIFVILLIHRGVHVLQPSMN